MKRVLLTNPYGPYDLEWGSNQYDILESRLQRGQGPFSLKSYTPTLALFLIAENINAETTVMEFPHIEDFEEELKKGYDFVGIQLIALTIHKVVRMIKIAREVAPQTKIVIGGYGVLNLDDPPPGESGDEAQYILNEADYICREEGVRFMRKLLGDEPADRPITQKYLPMNEIYFPGSEDFTTYAPKPMSGMALVALGCPNGCEFCCTSAMFKKQKFYVATPEETFETLKHFCRRGGGRATTVTLMDEDLLLNPDYVRRLGKLIQEDKEFGLRKLSYFCFGDIRSLTQYSMEELLECGVDSVWVGVESSINDVITSEHHIEKRTCDDIKSTFRAMDEYGVGITASTVLGWDFHTPDNIVEDIDFFVDLKPSAYQMTFLTACPGTELYRRMKEAGRINPKMTYHDVQQCNAGTFIPKNFGVGELKHYFDLAHKKLYESNGPGIFRTFQLCLNGYETCSKSRRPLLKEQKAQFFAERCQRAYPLLEACAKFAPSETVRERVRQTDEKYRQLFGEPTEEQKLFSMGFCQLVEQRVEKMKESSTDSPYDPPVCRMFYNPAKGPIPLVKKGRGPEEPVSFKAFEDADASVSSC
ncbi:MAG: radical SAM protein [Candidatus Abyssobacteria bacterium SURF_17]|uniref:Radical SAM protein n=1 Tax=Candidatus Abyssobacteria bacterium SURF_17 TaxID=2093361 RepID=A0A419F3X0_9BACT|nr:MAG: radical SAM protein [Candidatus Abyssubacteria bacterium SURF_17]